VVKYKVLEVSIDNNSIAFVPEKAIPLGIIVVPETVPVAQILSLMGAPAQPTVLYKNHIAFLMTYADWVEEFPDEAAKELTQGSTDSVGGDHAQ